MIEREKRQEGPAHNKEDETAEFVRDFAEGPPPKSIETVKAASDAVKKRAERVRELAYRLWEEKGCPDGRQDEFWHAADAEISRLETESEK